MESEYGNEYSPEEQYVEHLPEREGMGAYEAADTVEPVSIPEAPAPKALVKPKAVPAPITTGTKNKWLIVGGILFAGGLIWYFSKHKKR